MVRGWMLLVLLLSAGCEANTTQGGDYTCPNVAVIKNAQAGVHGAHCVKDADCKYGVCSKGALQLSGHVTTTEGVCTKNCACGPNSSCDMEDQGAFHFKCIKAPAGAGSECAVQCGSVTDCQQINPAFNACVGTSQFFTTGVKVCTIQ